jgi:hypothetical protein
MGQGREVALGQRLAPTTESAPSRAPARGRPSSWELVSASYLLVAKPKQARTQFRPERCVHDDRETTRQSERTLRIVDRSAIAKVQYFSLSWRW